MVGDSFNKQGNFCTRLILGDCRWVDLYTYTPESWKLTCRPALGSVMHAVLMVLTQSSLKTMSLKMAPTVGRVDRAYIPRTGEGDQLPRSSWRVKQWPLLLNGLLQHQHWPTALLDIQFWECLLHTHLASIHGITCVSLTVQQLFGWLTVIYTS